MTRYAVRNGWWEGVIEADEMAGQATDGTWSVNFWVETESPEGTVLVGIVTPNLVAVEEGRLVEDVTVES